MPGKLANAILMSSLHEKPPAAGYRCTNGKIQGIGK